MTIHYKRELITPQRARQLLDSMPENQRGKKSAKIPAYGGKLTNDNFPMPR